MNWSLTTTGIFVNLTISSNGWFRFMDSSRVQKICLSAGSFNEQNFPQQILGLVSSLEQGFGNALTEGLSVGSWSILEHEQCLAVMNLHMPKQKLVLTRTGLMCRPFPSLDRFMSPGRLLAWVRTLLLFRYCCSAGTVLWQCTSCCIMHCFRRCSAADALRYWSAADIVLQQVLFYTG
jgi:hypothetical protein